jgi:hypothetical protein
MLEDQLISFVSHFDAIRAFESEVIDCMLLCGIQAFVPRRCPKLSFRMIEYDLIEHSPSVAYNR